MTKMVTKMSTSQLLISKLLGIAYSDLSSRRNNNYSTFLSMILNSFQNTFIGGGVEGMGNVL